MICGCSSVVEHLLAKENVESSNLFIRFLKVLDMIELFYRLYYPKIKVLATLGQNLG